MSHAIYKHVYSSLQLLIISIRSMVNYLRSPLASVIQVLNINNEHGRNEPCLLTLPALNNGCMNTYRCLYYEQSLKLGLRSTAELRVSFLIGQKSTHIGL